MSGEKAEEEDGTRACEPEGARPFKTVVAEDFGGGACCDAGAASGVRVIWTLERSTAVEEREFVPPPTATFDEAFDEDPSFEYV